MSQDKRRYSLFSKTLKSCVEPVLRPTLKSHGAAASKILTEWEHIVGRDMAAHSMPMALKFSKEKNAGGVLSVACDGAFALQMQHLQPVILERIASYFGYRAVARIALVQRPVGVPPKPARKTKAAKKVDMSCLAGVEDPELKAALSGLAKTFANPTMDA